MQHGFTGDQEANYEQEHQYAQGGSTGTIDEAAAAVDAGEDGNTQGRQSIMVTRKTDTMAVSNLILRLTFDFFAVNQRKMLCETQSRALEPDTEAKITDWLRHVHWTLSYTN